MSELTYVGKTLVVIGLGLVAMGALVMLLGRLGGFPRLPGDLTIQRPGLTIYLPLGTSLLLSVVLTLLSLLFLRWRR